MKNKGRLATTQPIAMLCALACVAVNSCELALAQISPPGNTSIVVLHVGQRDHHQPAYDAAIAYILDRSASMTGAPLAHAITATKQGITSTRVGDGVAVVSFSNTASTDFEFTRILDDGTRDAARRSLDRIQPKGATSIGAGLQEGFNQLESSNAEIRNYVLLSDGRENTAPSVAEVFHLFQPAEPDSGHQPPDSNDHPDHHIHTIAYGIAADQQQMSEIASRTNGIYLFIPTQNDPVGLSLIFQAIHNRIAGEQILFVQPDSLRTTEQDEISFHLDGSIEYGRISLLWEHPSDSLEFTLVRPDGSIVEAATWQHEPDIVAVQGPAIRYFTISNPDSGRWRARIHGKDVNGQSSYAVMLAAKSELVMQVAFDKQQYATGEPVRLTARLMRSGSPVVGASVAVRIDKPGTSQQNALAQLHAHKAEDGRVAEEFAVVSPKHMTASTEPLETTLRLFDDGRHGDNQANDGIYGNIFSDTEFAGTYVFRYAATAPAGDSPFSRESVRAIFVEQSVGASIGDLVWHDEDADGVQDPQEAGVAEVAVRLYRDGSGLIDSTLTDASGLYRFYDLPAGRYAIEYELPPGFSFTGMNRAPESRNSDANPFGKTAVFDLAAGEVITGVDAGIFADTDGDQLADATEGDGDRDGDGLPDFEDFDPTGYFYCETTGQILTGASVTVDGPGEVFILADGSGGFYHWITDGTPGSYTMTIATPAALGPSEDCRPGAAVTSSENRALIAWGAGENRNNPGFLTTFDCSANPYDTTFVVDSTGLAIINNNIPLGACTDRFRPNFVLMADGKLRVKERRVSSGDLHSNRKIEFDEGSPGVHTGNLLSAGSIVVEEKNTIHGLLMAREKIKLESGVIVHPGPPLAGAAVREVELPRYSFSAGVVSKKLSKDTIELLWPGTYEDVEVSKRATLILLSGDYYFEELELDRDVVLQVDVSAGPVNVYVVDELEFDKGMRVELTADSTGHDVPMTEMLRFVTLQKGEFVLHSESKVTGTIIAPNAKAEIHKEVEFKGALYARKITVDDRATFEFH